MAQSLLEYVHVAGGILSEGMMEPSGALGQSDRTGWGCEVWVSQELARHKVHSELLALTLSCPVCH